MTSSETEAGHTVSKVRRVRPENVALKIHSMDTTVDLSLDTTADLSLDTTADLSLDTTVDLSLSKDFSK